MDTIPFLAILIPLGGAVLIGLTGHYPNVRETITLITSSTLCLLVCLLVPDLLHGGRPSFVILTPLPNLHLALEVEPLGMLFALVASFLWIVTSIYSIGYMRANHEHAQTRFYVCFAVAMSSTMGIAFSANLLTFFIFYEVLTLSTYPLVTHHGTPEAMKAGRTYLGILLSTSIGFQLLAILWTWSLTGTLTFTPGGILSGKADGTVIGILLFLYMFGIGKAALMPFHRWLPAAMVAPTPVSALLHAVAVVKAGVFAVTKVLVYVFGFDLFASVAKNDWLIFISGFTIIMASLIALRQDNLKRRLAYSTISQLSYVIMSAAVMTPLSVMGAAFHIAAHAFGKITLFFAAGSIYTVAHKTEVSQLNGIGRVMPWTMGAFAIGSLSMVGIPPAVGFVSKWFMLLGAWEAHQPFVVAVILISTLLNAAYFFPIVYIAFFRASPEHPHDGHQTHGEAPFPIVAGLTMTAGMTVLLFLFPTVPLELVQQLVGGAP